MNANELDERLVETAKFIDSVSSNWQAIRTIEITRAMLRQQQAEIEALKCHCGNPLFETQHIIHTKEKCLERKAQEK